MPHDRNGRIIHTGDRVIVPAVVTGIDKHDEYINIAVETAESMFPGEHKTPLMLNTRQVEVVESIAPVKYADEKSEPPEPGPPGTGN